MNENTPKRYAQPSERAAPNKNYLVVGGYDNTRVQLSCFTRLDAKGERGSAVKVIEREDKDLYKTIFESAGYEVFDRT